MMSPSLSSSPSQTGRLNQSPFCLPGVAAKSNYGKATAPAAIIFWYGQGHVLLNAASLPLPWMSPLTGGAKALSSGETHLIFWRDSNEYRQDIAAVINWIKEKEKAPLWLIGTSRGSVSVAHLAGSLPVDGAVFTATVTEVSKANKPTAYDADLKKIKVPSLIVHHKEDACIVTPVDSLPAFAAALKNAPKVETILFEGGDPDISGPCKARSAHGFLGIEDRVVGRIIDWMHANAPK